MQIKKYIAATLREATEQMKNELGSEAVILGSRMIPGNNKFGTQKMFEITAGVENEEEELQPVLEESLSEAGKSAMNFSDELDKLTNKIYSDPAPQKRNISPGGFKAKFGDSSAESLDEQLKDVIDTLVNREVSKPIVTRLVDHLKKYKNFLHPSNIDSYVISGMASMISTNNFEISQKGKQKVVALVGPTGVGKTTCIAKLAVISKILHNLDVGLISIDTYRLGALDQLRIFSEISNIDLLVAYEPKEMPALINSFKKKDIIFIDTAGRSQKKSDQLEQAKEFLRMANVDETYLVLSATGTTKNLLDVSEKFKVFDYSSLIFTKLDEAVTYGGILNVAADSNIPVSFLTNGQVIPDDIISADSDFIANMIYSGKFE